MCERMNNVICTVRHDWISVISEKSKCLVI